MTSLLTENRVLIVSNGRAELQNPFNSIQSCDATLPLRDVPTNLTCVNCYFTLQEQLGLKDPYKNNRGSYALIAFKGEGALEGFTRSSSFGIASGPSIVSIALGKFMLLKLSSLQFLYRHSCSTSKRSVFITEQANN